MEKRLRSRKALDRACALVAMSQRSGCNALSASRSRCANAGVKCVFIHFRQGRKSLRLRGLRYRAHSFGLSFARETRRESRALRERVVHRRDERKQTAGSGGTPKNRNVI